MPSLRGRFVTSQRPIHQVWVGRRSLAIEFSLFTASVLLLQGARFAFNIAVARAVPTADFTVWALLLAGITYAPALFLGSLNGLGRQLPYLLGADKVVEAVAAEASVAATFFAIAIACIVGGLVLTAAGLGGWAWPVALMGLGTLAFNVQQFVLRSHLSFNRASIQQLALGVCVLGGGVALLLLHTAEFRAAAMVYGICLSVAILVGIALRPPKIWRPNWSMWRDLVAVGFPIMLAGIVFSVFVTSDRWLATTLLGAHRASPYALASVVGASMLIVPNVISQQTYPRMAIAYGRTSDRNEILAMARRQSLIAGAAAIPLALLGDVAVILLVPILLPAYQEAVLPACIIALGFAAVAASTGFGNFLNVVGQQWSYLRVQLGSTAIGLVLMIAGSRVAGATGIALGVTSSYLVYSVWLRRAAETNPFRA